MIRVPGAVWRTGRIATLVVFAGVQLFLARDDTPTADEARHLRDGATMLDRGTIAVNPEHPPLPKLLAAAMLPPELRRQALAAAQGDPLVSDARFAVAADLRAGRLQMVRLPTIGLAVCALAAFGSLFASSSAAAAFAATLSLGAATPYLAHSHYVTTDLAPVAFLLFSVWAAVRFPGLWGAGLAGAFLGAAVASKFAAPLLVPFALVWIFRRSGARGLATAAAAGLFIVLGLEAFATRSMSGADLQQLSRRAFQEGGLGGPAPPSSALAYWSGALVGVSRPAGAYAIGFLDVAHRSATAEGADYWAGRIVTGAQPLYSPATLLVKNDLPLVLLAVVGAVVALLRRRSLPGGARLALLAGLFYLGLTSGSSLHLGVRHLLPVVVLLAALATAAGLAPRARILLLLLLSAHIATAAADFPWYVSARNCLGRLAIDPGTTWDLGDDWGQDLGRALSGRREPVIYVSVLHYRVPQWQGLFPTLRGEADCSCPHLVDRLAVDLLEASHRPDTTEAGKRNLAAFEPILDRVHTLEGRPGLRPCGQPTLLCSGPSNPMPSRSGGT